MKHADDIKAYFKQASLSTKADRHEDVFEKIQQAQGESLRTQPAKPVFWRQFMRSQKFKFGMAAILVIAMGLGMLFFQKTESVAWAIEDTIKALNQYYAMRMEGIQLNADGQRQEGQYWAMANEDQTQVQKERIEINGVPIHVVNGEKTWRYNPQTHTVIKNRPYGMPQMWMGGQLFEQLQSFKAQDIFTHMEVSYGQDAATGQQRAFIKLAWLDKNYNGPRSMEFEIDLETELPVCFKQWENANWEGSAEYSANKITYYETLPDELFEFKIPDGATVIEE